jgi:glyceraldehyde 3-phosphate dehydrogenase
MPIRVGINGFGRIGRGVVRAALGRDDIQFVAINDLTSTETNAHLLRYDSTQGRFPGEVVAGPGTLSVNGHPLQVLAERDPATIPWAEYGVEVVVESTGLFTTREKAAAHLTGGATRVIISAPSADADATFVIGVNDDEFDPERHIVVSNASCTTNCFAPMVKVIDDALGVRHGLMTTVHAYTNDQSLLDLQHRDLRRGRAAAMNIVPNSTGAAKAIGLVMPSMDGRLGGTSLRVPVPVGSITDFTVLTRTTSVDEVNEVFRIAAKGPLGRVLVVNEDPIVSSDIVGSPASCTFDTTLTMVIPAGDDQSLVKVFGWYDNEWGYANRVVDLITLVGGRV